MEAFTNTLPMVCMVCYPGHARVPAPSLVVTKQTALPKEGAVDVVIITGTGTGTGTGGDGHRVIGSSMHCGDLCFRVGDKDTPSYRTGMQL